jgi:hypothetical protein
MHGAAAVAIVLSLLGSTSGAPILTQVLQALSNVLQVGGQIVQILPQPVPPVAVPRAAPQAARQAGGTKVALAAKKRTAAPNLVARKAIKAPQFADRG